MVTGAGSDGTLRLGVFLSGQHPPEVQASAAVRDHLEQVALARELGLASIWAGQHFLSHPFQMFQSVPLLARMAAEAEGMTVGMAILLLTLLNPVEVAENVATLDAIAGGNVRARRRVRLSRRRERRVRRPQSPGRPVRAQARRGAAAAGGRDGDREGRRLRARGARLALVPDRPPPVWIAANSDRAVRRAARLGDAWFVNPHTRLDELERQMRLFRESGSPTACRCRRRTPVLKEVCVAATDEAAMEIARPYLKSKYDAYVRVGSERRASADGHAAARVRGADRGRAVRARVARDLRRDPRRSRRPARRRSLRVPGPVAGDATARRC